MGNIIYFELVSYRLKIYNLVTYETYLLRSIRQTDKSKLGDRARKMASFIDHIALFISTATLAHKAMLYRNIRGVGIASGRPGNDRVICKRGTIFNFLNRIDATSSYIIINGGIAESPVQ